MTTVLEVAGAPENKRIIYAPYPDENSPKDDKDLQVFSFVIFFAKAPLDEFVCFRQEAVGDWPISTMSAHS